MISHVSILLALLSSTLAQFPFSFAPELSQSVKQAKGIGSFVSLWKFSLAEDNLSQRDAAKITLAPKTLIVPGDLAMIHLIPQDASHPLYLQDKKHSDLRREFILGHLVLESISPDEAAISTPEGITATTLSGRSILLRKNKLGDLTAEGVDVVDVVSLTDGTQVYRLRQPLFNLRKKVKDAFDIIHGIGSDDPIGPPLILPEGFVLDTNAGARPPAPPPREDVKPPAIPPQVALRSSDNIDEGAIFPPAIPPHFKLNDKERSVINRLQAPSA